MDLSGWRLEAAEKSEIYKKIKLNATLNYDDFSFDYGHQGISYAVNEENGNDWCFDYANAWFKGFPKLIDAILAGGTEKPENWTSTNGEWSGLDRDECEWRSNCGLDYELVDTTMIGCYEGIWFCVELNDNGFELEFGPVSVTMNFLEYTPMTIVLEAEEMIAAFKEFVWEVKKENTECLQ